MKLLLCVAASIVGSNLNLCGRGEAQVDCAMVSTSGRNHGGVAAGSGGAWKALDGSSRFLGMGVGDLPKIA